MCYLSDIPRVTAIINTNQPPWTSVVRKINQYIYSWMKPGYAKDQEEYIISKCLLFQFICSASVLSSTEGNLFMITKILKCFRGYTCIYEDLYYSY